MFLLVIWQVTVLAIKRVVWVVNHACSVYPLYLMIYTALIILLYYPAGIVDYQERS